MKHSLRKSWWSQHDVLLMVGGKTLSIFGDAVLAVVLLLKVHDAGEGAFAVAALMACEALPMVALMGVAGRIADSRDSRTVLLVTTATQAVSCLALMLATGLAPVLALVLLIQTAQAISQATWSALTPRVAGEDHIGPVISLQQGLAAVAMPVGTAIGPFLLAALGADAAIAVDAATFGFLAAAVLLIRTRRHVHAENDQPRGIRLDLLRRDPLIWLLVLGLVPVMLVLVAVNVLDVFLVRDELGVDAKWYGLSSVAWGAGAVLGSTLAAKIGADGRRALVGVGALGTIAVLCGLTGISPNFPIYLACGLGVGVANGAVNACFGTLLMTRTADADRGKVSATVNGIFQAASLLGLPLGGLIGGLVGTRPAIVGSGIVSALVVAAVIVRMRSLGPQPTSTPAPPAATSPTPATSSAP